MRKVIVLVFAICISSASFLRAEPLTLQECINMALKNNLNVEERSIENRLRENTYRQNRESRYPTLSLTGGHNYNFGRTIDPFTNEFATQGIHANQAGLRLQFDLFEGFRNRNTLQKNQLEIQAGEEGRNREEWRITMEVVNAFMEVLFAEEMVTNQIRSIEILEEELQTVGVKVEAGEMTRNDLLQLEADLARRNMELTTARNNQRISYLTINQLMNMPFDHQFTPENPEIELPREDALPDVREVYAAARNHYPGFQQAKYEIQAAGKEQDIARSGYYPTIGLHASMGTGFSGARNEPVGNPEMQQIAITESGEGVVAPYFPNYQTVPFADQLDNNLNQTVGISISFPVYDGRNARYQSQHAAIQKDLAENRLEQLERSLEQEVENVHADATAALQRLRAAEASLHAHEKAYENTAQRYRAGMVNTLEYMQSGSNLEDARSEKLRSQYEFYLKKTLLDLYLKGNVGNE